MNKTEQNKEKEAADEQVKAKKVARLFSFLRFLEKIIYRPLFPYKRHGYTKKVNEGSLIIIGNHYSMWDVIPAAMATDRPIHFMAKSELFSVPVLGKIMTNGECIPVNRDGNDVQAVKSALRYLKRGDVINIFPEGTRNYSYDSLLPFKGGAAMLSIRTRTPIMPVVEIERIRLFHRVDVVYGEPIEFTKYYGKRMTPEEVEQCDNQLREIIFNMRQAFIDKHNIKLKPLKSKKKKSKKIED